MDLKEHLRRLLGQDTADNSEQSIEREEIASFVVDLRSKAEELGTPSEAVTGSDDVYADVVRTGTELLAEDFHVRSEAEVRSRAEEMNTKPELTYDLTDSVTEQAVNLYRSSELFGSDIDPDLRSALERYHGADLLETEFDDERRNAVGGYLLAEIIYTVADAEFTAVNSPTDLTLTVLGCQGRIRASESAETVAGTRLYETDDVRFFVDGLIHHLQCQAHHSYRKQLNERLEAFGENYRERRKLEALFERWERYSGGMYFHQFVQQYEQQYLDPDDPTVDVLRDERVNAGVLVEGFVDGLKRRCDQNGADDLDAG